MGCVVSLGGGEGKNAWRRSGWVEPRQSAPASFREHPVSYRAQQQAGVIEKSEGKKKRRRRIPLQLHAALLRPMNNASPQRRLFRRERPGFSGGKGPRRPATATIGCAFGLSNDAAPRKWKWRAGPALVRRRVAAFARMQANLDPHSPECGYGAVQARLRELACWTCNSNNSSRDRP